MTATYFVQEHVIFHCPADTRTIGSPGNHEHEPAQKATRAEMKTLIVILIPVPQSVASIASLTCTVVMKNALFLTIKISEFGK